MPLPAGFRLGPDFEERFEVLELLGEGGMGVVVKARQRSLDRIVAIKFLRMSISAMEKDARGRFEDEARLTARLNHPNVVQVFGTGASGDHLYIVYEFVEGESLRARLKTQGRLLPDEAFRVVVEAARGLDHAHEQGVLHRDVKPDNLLLTPDGTVKVADFGLAKRPEGGADRTQGGVIMGTPEYLAPERINEATPGPPSDLYALGVVLWECLRGLPPFTGADMSILLKHVNDPLPPLSDEEISFPEEVEALVTAVLEKDPRHRPSTRQWIDALERGREKLPTWKRRAGKRRAGRIEGPQHTARERAMPNVATHRLSGRGRPVASHRALRWKRWLLWGLPALCGLVAIFTAVLPRLAPQAPRVHSYRDLQVLLHPGEAVIRFRSDHPYPSRLRFDDGGIEVSSREPPEGTREHELRVKGLPREGVLRWKILYPDGASSLALTLETAIPVSAVSCRTTNAVTGHVVFRMDRPGRCRVDLRPGGKGPWKEAGTFVAQTGGSFFELPLRDVDLADALEFRFVVATPTVIHHGAPMRFAFEEDLVRRVNELAAAKTIRALLARDVYEDRKLRAPLLDPRDGELLGVLESLESFRPAMTRLFDSPHTPAEDARRLFASLQEVATLEQWTNEAALRERLRAVLTPAGSFVSLRPLAREEWLDAGADATELHGSAPEGVLFLPDNMGESRRSENRVFIRGWLEDHGIAQPREMPTRLSLPLPPTPGKTGAMRLLLRTVNLYYGNLLRLRLGDLEVLLGNPLQPGHMTRFAQVQHRPEGLLPDGRKSLEIFMPPQYWEIRLAPEAARGADRLILGSLCASPYEKRFILLTRVLLRRD